MTPVEGKQKQIQYPERYKNLLGKDYELVNIIKFFKEIEMFKETYWIVDEINMTIAVLYSYK